jgi:hypothetical protein
MRGWHDWGGAASAIKGERLYPIWHGLDKPTLIITEPFNGDPAAPGNGNMVALPMDSREQVDTFYSKAIELRATCDTIHESEALVRRNTPIPQPRVASCDREATALRRHTLGQSAAWSTSV